MNMQTTTESQRSKRRAYKAAQRKAADQLFAVAAVELKSGNYAAANRAKAAAEKRIARL